MWLFIIIHCKNESVYSTPLCPNTQTVYGLVCVLEQFKCLVAVHAFLSAPTQINAHKHTYENQ